MDDSSRPVDDTRGAEYADRLRRKDYARWKKVLDVQALLYTARYLRGTIYTFFEHDDVAVRGMIHHGLRQRRTCQHERRRQHRREHENQPTHRLPPKLGRSVTGRL